METPLIHKRILTASILLLDPTVVHQFKDKGLYFMKYQELLMNEDTCG